MNRINVVGMGPGSREYITPAAVKVLLESDIIIGGARNLESLDLISELDMSKKEKYEITGKLDPVVEYIKSNYMRRKVSVIASGDPCFYGILGYLKKFFPAGELNVIPGISSVQYMFAKLGMPWDSAYMGSVHGRDCDVAGKALEYRCAAFLTDGRESVSSMAESLVSRGLGERRMFVGCNLSYDNEVIHSAEVKEYIGREIDNNLCVVVISDE
jgi:cobalt-precorrin-7 (C5)-methyltransferase